MNAATLELFRAAQRADHAAVERLLQDPRVDLSAQDERGRTTSECVPVGDVTMDPEDVAALRHLARVLANATERVQRVEVLGALDAEMETQVRAHVARVAPSPADNGGGTLRVLCSPAFDADLPGTLWRLVIHGEYPGTLPSADPPWSLDAELLIVLDDNTGLQEQERVRWTTA